MHGTTFRALSVTSQVATPAAETAVYDCVVSRGAAAYIMVHTIELGGYSRSLYALTTDCRNAGTSTAVTPCREPSDYMYTAPWLMHLRHLPAAYTRLTACRNGPLDLHFFITTTTTVVIITAILKLRPKALYKRD